MTVVSNTGLLIALAKVNRLQLLRQLFGVVQIPPAVHRELLASRGIEAACLDEALTRFIQVGPIPTLPPEVKTVTLRLGPGEQQAIALAYELKTLLLIDDRLGRTAARRLGLPITGLAGVLIQAKEANLIPAVLPILDEVRWRGYWLCDELLEAVAKLTGETI